MARLLFSFVLALAVTFIVHGAARDLELAGRDVARVADADAGNTGPWTPRDMTAFVIRGEAKLLSDDHRAWMTTGLVLLAIVATAWGAALRELTCDLDLTRIRSATFDAGMIVAVVTPLWPGWFDAIQSPVGHGTMIAATAFAAACILAVRRPGLVAFVFVPVIGAVMFRESVGPGFALVPLIACAARPRHRFHVGLALGVAMSIVLIAFIRLAGAEWPWPGRNVIDPDVDARGTIAKIICGARFLALPMPPPVRLTDEAARAVAFTWAGILAGFAIWGHFTGRPARRIALTMIGTVVAGLLVVALSDWPLDLHLEDTHILAVAALGLAGFIAICIWSTLRNPRGVMLVVALFVLLTYTARNAVEEAIVVRATRTAPAIGRAITASIAGLSSEFDRVVVLGIPAPSPRAAIGADVTARFRAPWGTPRRHELVIGETGHYDTLPANLLGDATDAAHAVIVEWRPTSMIAMGRPPHGWRLVPLLERTEETTSSGLRLISPAADARVPLRRPETVDDDYAFVFEVDRPLTKTDRVVFYGFYDGPLGPDGRDRLTVRTIDAASVEILPPTATGVRYRWRPAVRPGPGREGITLEHPALGLANRDLHWTIGIVPVDEEEAAADHPEMAEEHAEHVADRRRPSRLAPMRRVRFVDADS